MSPLDTQLIGAIIFLFGLIVTGARVVYKRMADDLKACSDKLEAREKAEQGALDAFRVNQAEQAKAWLAGQAKSPPVGDAK